MGSSSFAPSPRRQKRVRTWTVAAVVAVFVVGSVGAYGASTWLTLHNINDRIQRQHKLRADLDLRQRHVQQDAAALRDAIKALPDAAGTALSDRDRALIRKDVQLVTAALTIHDHPALLAAASPEGGRIANWYVAAQINAHRALWNDKVLRRQRATLAELTDASEALDGALAHASVSVRVHLSEILTALPNQSATAQRAVRAAAIATPGTSPLDRARRLCAYVRAVRAAQ